jgi:hypothetical protein
MARLTRARARLELGQTRAAIDDARRALAIARLIGDPSLILQALAVVVALDGTDSLSAEAKLLVERIAAAVPDGMRQRFLSAQPVTFMRRC